MSDDRILILARVELQRTDWKLLRAMERFYAGAEWCDWRDEMRQIASSPHLYSEPLPPEPPFRAAAPVEPPPPEPAPVAEPAVDLPPIDPKDTDIIIEGFTGELRTGRNVVEGTMRSMDPPDRKRLFSLLNTELGRLKNQEALLGKSIPRRADVEELIGILAKVGEA
jgi:hypothetical protein